MNICVFGAAANTISPIYIAEGEALGRKIAARGHAVVFGGGGNGMMGAVARGAHEGGGEIIGVAPTFFPDGAFSTYCTAFHYTETMHERKLKMETLSDAFIVTPGGIGTYEEFMEVFTLRHLGRHEKPIVLLNTNGFFNPLWALLTHTVSEGFLPKSDLDLLFVAADVETALAHVEAAK